MNSEDQKTSRRAPAALLALFLAVLLGVPAPAASLAEAVPAGVKQLQPGKSPAAARLNRRASEDQADPSTAPPIWVGGAPRVETAIVSRRPSAGSSPAPDIAQAEPCRAPYQARAPPAA